MRKMLKITPILGLLLVVSMIATTATTTTATAPDEWNPGDEVKETGRSFNEPSWTNTSMIRNGTDPNLTFNFTMSYINYSDVQVFLLALNSFVDSSTNKISTLPYQLFGMHYTSNYGHEVFIGAVLAFLFAFNDTNGNGVPDPSSPDNEDFLYVLPYGHATVDSVDAPIVEPIPVEELGPGHYRFGMCYRNLWAKIVVGGDNLVAFLLSLILPIYTARFSELNVTYDIQFNDTTGEVTTQTFYTIGHVEALYFLGALVDPVEWPISVGVGAAHYVTIFTSRYTVETDEIHNVATGIDELEEATINVEGHRAFSIGTRGTYDLINETETPWETVESDKDAYNVLLEARLADLFLVAWQLGFSSDIFCTFAYAMSSYIQANYDSPEDLQDTGASKFQAQDLWYAVSFPEFQGLRVEHDPVYIASTDLAGIIEEEDEEQAAIGGIIVLALILLVAVVLIRKRRS